MIVVDDEIALQPQIMSIPITLTESKEQGILKRYQASPLPLSILLFTVNSLTALWIGRPLYEQTFSFAVLIAVTVVAFVFAKATFRWRD